MLGILLWAVIGFMALGVVINITQVGKPREPLSGGVVAVSTLFSSAVIVVLILSAFALKGL